MKDQLRQMAVIVTILATLVVNGLANALPLNGLKTGQISDLCWLLDSSVSFLGI